MEGEGRPWCLVLGGGGAKGVYHIGAWRALRELGLPVGAFIGNSIGAIMAAFLAQGLDAKLEEIGDGITVHSILDLPDLPRGRGSGAGEAVAALVDLARELSEHRGLDTGPLRRLLEENIDEAALRAGGRDLGVMTVNVSDLRPREVFLDDMEKGCLVDYLMASSALPGFAMPEIKGKRYLDGGLWDNMPYEMARRRGYRRLVVVDIGGAGLNRRPNVEGSETVYVRASIDMGGVLDFDPAFLSRFRELGYLDTLRAFDRLGGWRYFIRPDDELEAAFRDRLARTGGVPGGAVFPARMRTDRRLLMKLLDCAATSLELERVRAWDYRELAAAIAEKAAAEEERLGKAFPATGKGGGLDEFVIAAIKARRLSETPYFYGALLGRTAKGKTAAMLERILVGLCPELPAARAWFSLGAPFLADEARRG